MHRLLGLDQVVLLVHTWCPTKTHTKVDVDVLRHIPEVWEWVAGRVERREEDDQGVLVLPPDDVVGLFIEGHDLLGIGCAGHLVRDRKTQIRGRLGKLGRQRVNDHQVRPLLFQEPDVRRAALALAACPAIAGGWVGSLRALQTVEVEEDGNRVPLTPLKEQLQILQLPKDKRWSGVCHPIAKGHTHSVDAASGQPDDVVLVYPGRPVLLHSPPALGRTQLLHQAVLVNR
mmetsp:Transcript_12079/g.36438  ORF Transcript_12079/g.36438 Transcript_12079/m.36438 type:complete len:230 (-) Transcript_12079:197-886(-)